MSDGEPIRENVSVADPQHVDRDLQIYKGAVRKTVERLMMQVTQCNFFCFCLSL